MSFRYAIIFTLSALLFTACAQLPDDYGLYQEPVSAWAIEQNNTRLQTIANLVRTGRGNEAKQQADMVNTKELTPQQKAQFNLLYAQIMLNFGEAEQAIKKLAGTETGQLGINDKIKFYQSQAFAYSLTGNLLESAKARIALDPFLIKPDERKKNQAVILESLGLVPENLLQKQSQTAGLSEWSSLAKILASRNKNPASFNSALAGWRAVNPEHAANLYLTTITNMADNSDEIPKSIAVLLPESGPYADAGKAVKAGFLAAHSRDSAKPELHFYDTETAKAAELYQKAVRDGAKLVIGPLNKESIQDLAKVATITVPVLALNHAPNLSKANFYQFALSPIDDVAEITHKAALDGHKKAVLLVPDTDQGKRIATYLTQAWQALGGSVLKKETYDPKKNDFSATLKKLAGFDESQARIQNVQKAFPEVADASQKSNDVDALFLSAYGKEGKIINTQLLQAGNVPVYALPTIYSGLPDSINDNPLNGITFCDTPWLFNGAYNGVLSMMSLKDILNQFPSSYIRLVAMGIDAYYLSAKLPSLNTTVYSGATGNLSLDSDNRIKRALVCAKFVAGQPELIGFSHSPTESDFSGTGIMPPAN